MAKITRSKRKITKRRSASSICLLIFCSVVLLSVLFISAIVIIGTPKTTTKHHSLLTNLISNWTWEVNVETLSNLFLISNYSSSVRWTASRTSSLLSLEMRGMQQALEELEDSHLIQSHPFSFLHNPGHSVCSTESVASRLINY